MALCRRREKHSNPMGKKNIYVFDVEPIGYPETSSICGLKNCRNPGIIWLTQEESNKYNIGERYFSYASAASKVKVKDSSLK